MTPREYKSHTETEVEYQKMKARRESEKWHIRLGRVMTLEEAKSSMKPFALTQDDVPLIIKLTENPKYFTSKLFTGAVDLFTHDCIHVLLGRGVKLKDEAFVIGYTMGSARKMRRWRRNLFMWVCKYLYPEGYEFGEEERFVFYSGVMAGSKCETDLTKVDFEALMDRHLELSEIRHLLGIDSSLLRCYYCTEKKLFKDVESQRLI